MQHSDRAGNVLRCTPGQGCEYLEKPAYSVMTNFSPWKGNTEQHPWMGWDRYQLVQLLLRKAGEDFDAAAGMAVLKTAAQTLCPTVVSMVYDAAAHTVHWCENRQWEQQQSRQLAEPMQ